MKTFHSLAWSIEFCCCARTPAPCLLVLARIGRLELLGEELILVDAVVQEAAVKSDDAAQQIAELAKRVGTISVLPAENLAARLGPGEKAVLTWANTRPDNVACVIDDRAARIAARALNIPTTGTLGLLLKAKVDGQISQARPWVERAVECGLYLGQDTISKALKAVGE